MKMWQAHKLTHDLAMKELYRTRGPASLRYVENIMRVQQYEREMAELEEQRKVAKMLQKGLRPRIQHPHVEEWKAQYEPQWYGVAKCFKFLLFRGCSRAGKTVFAENLFGEEHCVLVQCQGLGADLPSLRHVDRHMHRCIVFDEIHHSAVLNNKAFFQAGKNIVDLAQSKCGAHRYGVFPYQVAMICTSNRFATTVKEGLENEEDEDWITNNCYVVTFGKNETCFQPSSAAVSSTMAGAGA